MDAVEQAKSGHPGMPMGMADVATVLFTRFLKFDASAPDWPDRDRFVLSAGHGSMLLYALLHLTGYPGMSIDELQALPPARLQDRGPSRVRPRPRHRDDHRPAGPGPRQRRRHGARRAPAQRAAGRRHRRSLHLRGGRRRLPDGGPQPRGDLARRPPQAQQADRAVRRQSDLDRRAYLARRLRRPDRALPGGRLEHRVGRRPRSRGDRRRRSSARAAPTGRRWSRARRRSATARRPRPGKASTHGSPLGAEEIAGARAKLGWAHAPFEVPADVLAAWRACGSRGAAARECLDEAHGTLSMPRHGRPSSIPRVRRRSAIASAIAAAKTGCRHIEGHQGDPQLVGGDARAPDPGAARTDRRLGRPHRLQQHQGQGPGGRHAGELRAAATSTTACASTAWPPP